MPTYLYQCVGCAAQFEELRPMADRDQDGHCERCGEVTKRTLKGQAPSINTSESATALDGSRKKEFQDLKEANRLKIESFEKRPTERREINKEIKKLERAKR